MDNAHQAKLDAARQRFKRLPGEWRKAMALGIFIGAGGFLWRDTKGYRARCYVKDPAMLIALEEEYGGKVFCMARAKVVCNITTKGKVEQLQQDLNNLVPGYFPPVPPARSVGRPKKCKHCGNSVNNHDPECYDAVSES